MFKKINFSFNTHAYTAILIYLVITTANHYNGWALIPHISTQKLSSLDYCLKSSAIKENKRVCAVHKVPVCSDAVFEGSSPLCPLIFTLPQHFRHIFLSSHLRSSLTVLLFKFYSTIIQTVSFDI